jgi:hypothetical protein
MENPALKALAGAAVAAALSACASTPPPVAQLAAARATVSQAQPVAITDAPAELHTAQTKLARAEDAMQRGDYLHARLLAEQAEVDARYAWTLAENARMQRAAAELDQGIRTLREELERNVR